MLLVSAFFFFSVASSGLIIEDKTLEAKITKHQEIVPLGIAKRDTVDRLVSKAISDNRLGDSEFQIIVSEFEQYNALKGKVRAKLTRQPSRKNVADVEKITKDVRGEVEAEFQKELKNLLASSN